MHELRRQIQSQTLLKIKRIIDKDVNGNKLSIARTHKNMEFMREYNLNYNDIKNIIRSLSVDDCYIGPVADRNSNYDGMVFVFYPYYENIKLYVKIRYESEEKVICISVHEFGKYDGV